MTSFKPWLQYNMLRDMKEVVHFIISLEQTNIECDLPIFFFITEEELLIFIPTTADVNFYPAGTKNNKCLPQV